MERLTKSNVRLGFVDSNTLPSYESLYEKLRNYEELEEKGRLPKLPCAVGDKVWDNDFGEPCSYTVSGFSFGDLNDLNDDNLEEAVLDQIIIYYTNANGSITGNFAANKIGKTVFFTKEEAMKAMREKETKEMDRLTIQYDNYFVPKELCTIDRLGGADDCMSCEEYCQANGDNCDECGMQKCFEKLAAYENTGLTPEQIKELQGKATEKRYPILGTGESIPWKVVENHRGQAIKNHRQTIEGLAERGGMSWYEMYCVLSEIPCIPQTKINEKEIKQKVLNIIKKEQPEGDWFLCKEGIFDD